MFYELFNDENSRFLVEFTHFLNDQSKIFAMYFDYLLSRSHDQGWKFVLDQQTLRKGRQCSSYMFMGLLMVKGVRTQMF